MSVERKGGSSGDMDWESQGAWKDRKKDRKDFGGVSDRELESE